MGSIFHTGNAGVYVKNKDSNGGGYEYIHVRTGSGSFLIDVITNLWLSASSHICDADGESTDRIDVDFCDDGGDDGDE